MWRSFRKKQLQLWAERYPDVEPESDEAFQARLDELQDRMLEGVKRDPQQRTLHMGARLDCLLAREASAATGKRFLLPAGPAERQRVERFVEQSGLERVTILEREWPTVLQAFPEGTFQAATIHWTSGGTPLKHVLRWTRKSLKPGGWVGALVARDGSPEVPLRALARALRGRGKGAGKVQRTGAPASPGKLRKWFWKAGLNDVRSWLEGMTFRFTTGAQAFDHFSRMAGSAFPFYRLSEGESRELRARFGELIEREPWGEEGIRIAYEFVAACGRKA